MMGYPSQRYAALARPRLPPSGRNPLRRAPRFFGRRNEKVGRHAEARVQPLYHCDAQLATGVAVLHIVR